MQIFLLSFDLLSREENAFDITVYAYWLHACVKSCVQFRIAPDL